MYKFYTLCFLLFFVSLLLILIVVKLHKISKQITRNVFKKVGNLYFQLDTDDSLLCEENRYPWLTDDRQET